MGHERKKVENHWYRPKYFIKIVKMFLFVTENVTGLEHGWSFKPIQFLHSNFFGLTVGVNFIDIIHTHESTMHVMGSTAYSYCAIFFVSLKACKQSAHFSAMLSLLNCFVLIMKCDFFGYVLCVCVTVYIFGRVACLIVYVI